MFKIFLAIFVFIEYDGKIAVLASGENNLEFRPLIMGIG
jgi:hypothetical protein